MDEEIRTQLVIVAAQARELSEALGNSKAERLETRDHTHHFYNNLLTKAHELLGDSATRKLLPSGIHPAGSALTMAKSDVMAGAAQLASVLEKLLGQESGRVEELEREKQALEAKVLEAEARAVTIKDDELLDRCVDLLLKPGKADIAVGAACTVLEHRIRKVAGLPKGVVGVKLVEQALGKNGKLVTSDVEAEQEGFHLLCRGVIGFFKNPTSHRVIEDYDLTRARQVVGLIDTLLQLLREAKKRSD